MHIAASVDRQLLRRCRVLVVDDDREAREALVATVAFYGGVAEGVASAAEARARLKRRRFDVLLSDVNMPDEDGYELLRSIRRGASSTRKIAALAITGRSSALERRYANAAGFDDLLAKPVTLSAVVASVRALSRLRR